jgi:Carboxypeptidase regulatory-like domain/Secretion system C-terminal sorting domain
MYRIIFSLFTAIFIPLLCFAQPQLIIVPNSIEYKDDFNRLQNVYFINAGTDTLEIDSTHYRNYNYYFLRFDVDSRHPLRIPPDDTIKMDCILSSYYRIPSKDTSDTMIVYSNAGNKSIKINIDYYDDEVSWGIIKGRVTSNGSQIGGAAVYFLQNGTGIKQYTFTDVSGFFSVAVPPGFYSVAAQKDSFYTTFYGGKFTPFLSKIVGVEKDAVDSIGIELVKMDCPGYSIEGQIIDPISTAPLSKTMIVARRGGHNPSKVNACSVNDSIDGYTTIINYDINKYGTYKINNILKSGEYFIQSFSDYYVPSYYKENGFSSSFWQDADSININANLTGVDIFMPRDSSFGGGKISGKISVSEGVGDNFNNFIVFAQPVNKSYIINYAVIKDDGSFDLEDLPYGNYQLTVQKIGYDNAYMSGLEISPGHTSITDVLINFVYAGIEKKELTPSTPYLFQNYPNPFNPSTNIEMFLPSNSNIILKVSNILGQETSILYKGYLSAGRHKFIFNGDNLSSGTYFVTLTAGNFFLVKKILLLK